MATCVVSDDVLDVYKINPIRFCCGVAGFNIEQHPAFMLAAPEPEDVKWENLGYTFWQRLRRVVINWLIMIAILAICLVANIFINNLNVSFSTNPQKEYSQSSTSRSTIIGLNIACMVVVFFIHQVLCFSIPLITRFVSSLTLSQLRKNGHHYRL
jgi:hypothetical protein